MPEFFKDDIQIFEVVEKSGFFYIPNPFRPIRLLSLLRAIITRWSDAPNMNNLSDLNPDQSQIWRETLQQLAADPKLSLRQTSLNRLRWASLGFHYKWSEKRYHGNANRSEMPPVLTALSRDIVALLTGVKERATTARPNYTAQAGIINYYHSNSTMCFHQDNAELDMEQPLISFNFGLPAIFLIGNADASDAAAVSPVLLEHGDVAIMSGPARLAFHGVPRIFELPFETLLRKMTDCSDLDSQCATSSTIPSNYAQQTDRADKKEKEEKRFMKSWEKCCIQSEKNLLSRANWLDNNCLHKLPDWPDLTFSHQEERGGEEEKQEGKENTTKEACNEELEILGEKWQQLILWQFISRSRVNLNVRQVFPAGQNEFTPPSLSTATTSET